MLQGKPAAQGGVPDRVREENPRRPGRKTPETLWPALLKFIVGLEEIVEAEHECIIQRPLRPTGPQQPKHLPSHLARPTRSLAGRQACLFSKALEQPAKGLRSNPDARLTQVDVDEQAQDAVPVRRTAGKGI